MHRSHKPKNDAGVWFLRSTGLSFLESPNFEDSHIEEI
jgi:hypothetical protein